VKKLWMFVGSMTVALQARIGIVLRCLRIVGDALCAVSAVALVVFLIRGQGS
jgi:hypothetical protein